MQHARERAELRALRRAIADRITADIELLDRLDGDPDLEAELDLCVTDEPHDALDEDTGIADLAGLIEQGGDRWQAYA